MYRKLLTLLAALVAAGWLSAGCQQWQGPIAGPNIDTEVATAPARPAPAPPAAEKNDELAELAGFLGLGTGQAVAAAGPVDNLGRFSGGGSDATPQSTETARQHSFGDVGIDFDPDLDRSGRWLVFASTRHNVASDLYIKRVDGVTVTQLTNDTASDVQPAFSPAGTQIAFASNRGGSWDLWLIDVDGRNRIRLTDSPAQEIAPAWSPDGRRLAYCVLGTRSRQWEMWVMDLSNPAARTFIGFGLFPSWSPDGRADRLVYQKARQRGTQDFSIWTVDLVKGEPRYPTEVVPARQGWAAICPSWSPDGKHIVFTETKLAGETAAGQIGHASAVAVINADGTNRRRLTEARGLNANPIWSADGNVYFTSDRQGRESIFSVTATEESPAERAVTQAESGVLTNQPTANVPVKE